MKNEIIWIMTCDKNDGFQHLKSKFSWNFVSLEKHII
jgi:hypothetical protein